MFGHRFFGARYYGPHYWGPGIAAVVQPEPEPQAPAAPASPDRGFDEYMQAFARERMLTRHGRENDEIMKIIEFEEAMVLKALRKILRDD